jgi:hypothetical protein
MTANPGHWPQLAGIPAIPTMYDGTEYRSRLESKWAAFFDLIGWKFTYEPVDGNAYLPDFLVHGRSPLMIEIKPAVTEAEFWSPVGKVAGGLQDCWNHGVLILGIDPLPLLPTGTDLLAAGLLGDYTGRGWDFGVGGWFTCRRCHRISAQSPQTGVGYPCGHCDSHGYVGDEHLDRVIAGNWGRATNAVKWRGRKA